MWLRTRRSGVRISQGAPLLESKGFNQSELHPDRLGNTRRSSMSSSHKYFFILQNQHVTDANLTSFYGPQKLSRKRHTLPGPTRTCPPPSRQRHPETFGPAFRKRRANCIK